MKKYPKPIPGDLAMWIIIFAELLVFGIFFIAYAVVRINNVDMFNDSQLTLNREMGAINTILLITASYFVVMSIHALKNNTTKKSSHYLYAAIASGSLFILIKTLEFHDKMSAGIDIGTNTFYMFYFLLTLFHYFHVILGLMILFVVALKTRKGHYKADQTHAMETAGSYWHMVDLVWIIMFPLIYVIR